MLLLTKKTIPIAYLKSHCLESRKIVGPSDPEVHFVSGWGGRTSFSYRMTSVFVDVTLTFRLFTSRFSDMNLHSTHQTSDVCLFELVPPSPDGYFTRARSFSNGSPSRGVKSRDHSEPVSKAGKTRITLHMSCRLPVGQQ